MSSAISLAHGKSAISLPHHFARSVQLLHTFERRPPAARPQTLPRQLREREHEIRDHRIVQLKQMDIEIESFPPPHGPAIQMTRPEHERTRPIR